MRSAAAFAKINLGLVVGSLRSDGKHEVATALVRIDLHDTVGVERTHSTEIVVEGFDDTIVRGALEELTRQAAESCGWKATIDKHIPVAAGLGGGSSDAGTALRLANDLLDRPLEPRQLHALAADVGSDVPFFLSDGPQLATGDGSELEPIAIPLDFWVVLVLPLWEAKISTADVYRAFDASARDEDFDQRRAALVHVLREARIASDLAALPHNDLTSSPVTNDLLQLGAVHADVTGAGPAVYGLFEDQDLAERAAGELESRGRRWVVRPSPVS